MTNQPNEFEGVPPCNSSQPHVLGHATVKPDARVLPVQLPRETGWTPYPTAA